MFLKDKVKRLKIKNCAICGKKIGFFRKLSTKILDNDPIHLIPLWQFCSSNCADKGFELISDKLTWEEFCNER